MNARTKFGWTPLHSSVYWNQAACVELLLRSGIDVNALTEGGQTALHLACAKYDVMPQILAMILATSGVDVQLKNAQGDSCQDLAVRHTPYEYFFYPFRGCCSASLG